MEVTTKTLTISEIARYCNCSKQTINKHINGKGLVNTFTIKNGKKVKAYNLTSTQLQELKNLVLMNKGLSTQSTSDYQPITNDYLKEYIEIKSKYESANAQLKLLEDRQGGLLQEVRERTEEIKNQCQQIGSLTSKLELSEKSNKKYKKIIITLSAVLGVIIGLLTIKLVLI